MILYTNILPYIYKGIIKNVFFVNREKILRAVYRTQED